MGSFKINVMNIISSYHLLANATTVNVIESV